MKDNLSRRLAFDALTAVRQREAFLGLYLDAAFRRANASSSDRRLATAIASGVLRHRRLLDWQIDRLSKTPTRKLEPAVLDALRMGLYQLWRMDGVPAHAAVNETVKLVPGRARGFINGVLREFGRTINALPEPAGADEIENIGVRSSLPDWIVRLWATAYGQLRAREMAESLNAEPPAVLRALYDRNELVAALAAESIEARPTNRSRRGVRVSNLESALASSAFKEGLFAVQGEASQIVGELVGARPGERVLDVCAAPGGKATDLARAVGPAGRVLAADRHEGRLSLVVENAARLRLENIETRVLDAAQSYFLDESPFDRVLVDAPCSGLGQLAKHPDAKWRVRAEDLPRLAETQRSILGNAATHVRPGGLLVYAVCTLSPEENRGVVENFLAGHPEFRAEDARDLLPAHAHGLIENGDLFIFPTKEEPEGFYASALRRNK